ncbi:MAG: DUF4920 domain-containing protein [Fidelibacterota bacterium]
MKYIYILITSILLFSCNSTPSPGDSVDSFGDAITMTKVTSLSDIFSQKDENVGQEFLIEGTAVEICQKKGCWMDIKDGDDMITVRFKDYAFFMPKDGAGREAKIQGVFSKETYEDTDENGNAVTKEFYQIIASGVELQKRFEKS